MDPSAARAFIDALWEREAVSELTAYIRIPNKSPAFDPDWAAHGYMDEATERFAAWAKGKIAAFEGASLEVIRLPGRTPVIFIEVPAVGRGAEAGGLLLYGHLDKQPEMTGWSEGLGPWTPVLKDGRLYGRGGADDGYALFAALGALAALRDQGADHARATILIEACEESGSFDLPAYVDHLAGRLGEPDLVICLDSGCANYEQLWLTTSLRGIAAGVLTVEILTEGVHSGDASGVAPSSFRILRALLSRLEDEESGEIRPPSFHAQIPPSRIEQAKVAAAALGQALYEKFPFAEGARPVTTDPLELILNRTWRPALEVTGLAGAPGPLDAGNVLRPFTTAKVSLRLPPSLDAAAATRALAELFATDPPYGAKIVFEGDSAAGGWNAPELAPWLSGAIGKASSMAFGRGAAMMGEGGSIPFMAMLGEKFPEAQFVVTGVLGPHSNAHGPNEFLDLATARRVSLAVASVIADHAARPA